MGFNTPGVKKCTPNKAEGETKKDKKKKKKKNYGRKKDKKNWRRGGSRSSSRSSYGYYSKDRYPDRYTNRRGGWKDYGFKYTGAMNGFALSAVGLASVSLF